MTIGRIDHFALGVPDLEAAIRRFTGPLGLRLIRRGTVGRTGSAMAMVGDGTGMKIELIETAGLDAPVLLHIAFRSDDVASDAPGLRDGAGFELLRGPNPLPAAAALSALFSDRDGLEMQIIQYEEGSPDTVQWDASTAAEGRS
jgi:catechol 2,3-dioxygenase-like lactoylglutathione lyase family enzyme